MLTLNEDNTITITGFKVSEPLTEAMIPATICGYPVVGIEAAAFSTDSVLQSVEIHAENIGESAFVKNTALKSIVIGEEVKTIGADAFGYIGTAAASGSALNVTTIWIEGTDVEIAETAFAGVANQLVFYVKEELAAVLEKILTESLEQEYWSIIYTE